MSNLSGSGTLRGALSRGGDTPTPMDVYWDDILDKPNFAEVATSGSYNNLLDKPNFAAVATSGSYNDLLDKPNIINYTCGNGININNNVISVEPYNINESIIGTWLDNSPIYRSVIILENVIELTSNNWVTINFDTSNIATIVNIRVIGADGTLWMTTSANCAQSQLRLNNNRSSSIYAKTIVIEYVKEVINNE